MPNLFFKGILFLTRVFVMDPYDLPLAAPPPGIRPNPLHPESRAVVATSGIAICVFLMMVFVLMRVYIKLFISRTFGWDDCTETLSCLLSVL